VRIGTSKFYLKSFKFERSILFELITHKFGNYVI